MKIARLVPLKQIWPHRRAFFLEANQARIKARHKPRFVDLAKFRDPEPIPIFLDGQPESGKPLIGLYAMTGTNSTSFKLHSMDRDLDNIKVGMGCHARP